MITGYQGSSEYLLVYNIPYEIDVLTLFDDGWIEILSHLKDKEEWEGSKIPTMEYRAYRLNEIANIKDGGANDDKVIYVNQNIDDMTTNAFDEKWVVGKGINKTLEIGEMSRVVDTMLLASTSVHRGHAGGKDMVGFGLILKSRIKEMIGY